MYPLLSFSSNISKFSLFSVLHCYCTIPIDFVSALTLYNAFPKQQPETILCFILKTTLLGLHGPSRSCPSVHFSSVAQSCPTLCDPMDCSTPDLLIHHQLLAVYSNSCPLGWWCHPSISSSVFPFSSYLNLSQHQSLFQWISSSHQVAKVREFQHQHQPFEWIFRTDLL